VYSIICNITKARYIGSSINIGNLLVDHLVENNTNEHLQNAIAKYGLKNFTVSVVENCNSQVLLEREQHYLDILFTLPDNLRYNFARFAEASFKGLTHSEETRAKLSEANSGANNPMYGRTGALSPMYGKTHTPETLAKMSDSQNLVDRSGANNPMFGKVAANAMTINVYSLDNKLVRSFPSQVAAAKWIGVSNITVSNYIKSGKVWNNQYTFLKIS
jgi:group I intron endonuclease